MLMPSRSLVTSACAVALLAFAVAQPTLSGAPQADSGDRVVLITIDGARTEEIFGGLDLRVLKSTLKEGQTLDGDPTYKRFWSESAEERRARLMPFFWNTLMAQHGSIAGHRARQSAVRLTNRHWFSYPGYAEILLGEAHDDVIKSNDPIQNPYPTVLEVLRDKLALRPDQVATFGSWGVFNAIAEHTGGATTVDAGPDEPWPTDAAMRELRSLQAETLPPWANVRSDIFTIRSAMAHFDKARPRVVYIALDETDDWAHDGRYDRLLDAYVRTDRYLEQLWTWLQTQPDYRGRTHLLITTDHGRGHTPADWRDHGAKIVGADEVWMAFASPRMTERGEWRSHPPVTASQIAATLAGWMGVDWQALRPSAGAPIERANVKTR